MFITFNDNCHNEIELVCNYVESKGCTFVLLGNVLGVNGQVDLLDVHSISMMDGVLDVRKVKHSFRLSSRDMKKEDSIIKVGNVLIGGDHKVVIAGPCSIESEQQIITVGDSVKSSGATLLRGGAFKPRTSPYEFTGLGNEGLDLLVKAREVTGLPIVCELLHISQLDEYIEKVDLIQIGARNMQNFEMLHAVGKTNKPILLKRGLSATYQEWLMAAEYIMSMGNLNVILCERGIRTFETMTRNTLDLQAIPVIKQLSHLPIIIDPSHAGGDWSYVEPMAKAAIVAGSDGLMIEVHNEPENALCDGQQSLTMERFDGLMNDITKLMEIL